MPKLSRIVFTVFLTLWLSFPLLASPIKATGYGKSEKEARTDAYQALASQFKITVFSHQSLVLKESVVGQEISKSEHFQYETTTDVSFDLLGIKYSEAAIDTDGNFKVIASIGQDSLSNYINELLQIQENIETIEHSYDPNGNLDERRANLLLLLNYYDKFEGYTLVALSLDQNAKIPILKRTKAGVELDYLNLLNLLQKDLEEKEKELLNASTMESEAKRLLTSVQQEIARNAEERNQWIEYQAERRNKLLMKASDRAISQALAMQRIAEAEMTVLAATLKSTANPKETIEKIETTKASYATIEQDLQKKIEQHHNEINERYGSLIAEVEGRPYRLAQLVGDVPTQEAKLLREREVADLRQQQEDSLIEIKQQLSAPIVPLIERLQEQIVSGYMDLEATQYSINSATGDVSIKVGRYDGNRKSWPVALRFTIMGIPFAEDFYIPYENVTNARIPSLSPESEVEWAQYEAFLDMVEIFDAFLSNNEIVLNAELDYVIFPSAAPSTYSIGIQQIALRRIDTQDKILDVAQLDPPFLSVEKYESTPAYKIDIRYYFPFDSAMVQYSEKAIALEARKEKKEQKKTLLKSPELYPSNRWFYFSPISVGVDKFFQMAILGVSFGVPHYPMFHAGSSFHLFFEWETKPELDTQQGVGLSFFIEHETPLDFQPRKKFDLENHLSFFIRTSLAINVLSIAGIGLGAYDVNLSFEAGMRLYANEIFKDYFFDVSIGSGIIGLEIQRKPFIGFAFGSVW